MGNSGNKDKDTRKSSESDSSSNSSSSDITEFIATPQDLGTRTHNVVYSYYSYPGPPAQQNITVSQASYYPGYYPEATQPISPQLTPVYKSRHNKIPGISFYYTKECDFITEKQCCICFFDYEDNVSLHMLPCDHIFHHACLQDWYMRSQTCPMCRDETYK